MSDRNRFDSIPRSESYINACFHSSTSSNYFQDGQTREENEESMIATIPHDIFPTDTQKVRSTSLSPVDTASLWGRTSYTYVNPLLSRAAKEPLNMEHLPSLAYHDRITHTVSRLEQAWYELYERQKQTTRPVLNNLSNSPEEHSPSDHVVQPDSNWLLLRACFQAHRSEVIIAGLFALAEGATFLIQPILLRQLVIWLQNSDNNNFGEGFGLAFGLVVASLCQAIVHHYLYYYTMRMGWNLRIGFIGFIHKELLSLNSSTVTSISPGKIINLISTDVLRFDTFLPSLHFIWTSPIEVIICGALIILEVRYICLLLWGRLIKRALVLNFKNLIYRPFFNVSVSDFTLI